MRNPFHKILNSVFLCCLVSLMVYCTDLSAEQLTEVDSLKQELLKSQHDTSRINILFKLSKHYIRQEPDIALSYANEVLKLAEKTNQEYSKALIFHHIGGCYLNKADYPKALFYHFQATRLLQSLNKEKETFYTLNGIGGCYLVLKEYKLAKKYLLESLKIQLKYNILNKLEANYNNLGIASIELGQIQEGIAYYRKAIEANKESPEAYINLGEEYMKGNQLQEAEYYYKKGLLLNKSNDRYATLSCYEALGRLYLKRRDFKSAEKYLFMAKELAEKSGISNVQQEIYTSIVKLYEEQANFRSAHIYNKQLQQFKDSIFKEVNTRQINEIQAKYELDRKDKEIQIAKSKVEKQNLYRNFLITGVLLLIIIGVVITRNIILKQRVKNKILNEKNALIEKDNAKLLRENTEAKYEVLKSKINPHFLFNNLSILSSLLLEDQKLAIRFITRFSSLYRMILETGNKRLISLEKEMTIVNDYLFLQKMRFENGLHIQIDTPGNNKDYSLPPFSIQMVVENAIKHNIISKQECLTITIQLRDDYIIVSNNLCKKDYQAASTSTGQENITDRYRLLSNRQPTFVETPHEYIVKLPLLITKQKAAMPV